MKVTPQLLALLGAGKVAATVGVGAHVAKKRKQPGDTDDELSVQSVSRGVKRRARRIARRAARRGKKLAREGAKLGVNAATFGVRNRLTLGAPLRTKRDNMRTKLLGELFSVPIEVLKGGAAGVGGAMALNELQKHGRSTDEREGLSPLGALGVGTAGGLAVGEVAGRTSARRFQNLREQGITRTHRAERRVLPRGPHGRVPTILPADPPLKDLIGASREHFQSGRGVGSRHQLRQIGRVRGLAGGLAAGGIGALMTAGLRGRRGRSRHGEAKDAGTPMGGYAVGRRRGTEGDSRDARVEPGSPEHLRALLRETRREHTIPSRRAPFPTLPPPPRPPPPGLGQRLMKGLRGFGQSMIAGPDVPISAPLPGGGRLSGSVRLSPAGGLALAGGYGVYQALQARQRRRRRGEGDSTDAAPEAKAVTKLRPGIPSLLLTGAAGGMALSAALRKPRKKSKRAGGRGAPAEPSTVTLDPETLQRLKALHGHAGSRELREYGQSLGGRL